MPQGNHVSLLANMTADPIMVTGTDKPIVNFAVAWNDPFDKNEERSGHFYECKAFGKTAEIVEQYGAKGRKLLVEGKIKQDRWEKDGEKRSRIVIYVDSVNFCDQRHKQDDETKSDSFGNNDHDDGW